MPAWLTKAESQIGYHEGPDNDTKFGAYFGLNHEPWCALYVSWCCAQSKHPLPVMQSGMKSGYAAVADGINYAKANGLWIPSWKAQAGDAICYGWAGPSSAPADMHTGFIVSSGPQGSTGHTVEGNRADQVERQTFTVGESVVLGCIDVNRLLLGRPSIVVKPKKKATPDPQPKHPTHPANTGPTPLQAKRRAEADALGESLGNRKRPVKAGTGDRKRLRVLRAAITKALHRK